MKYPTSVGLIVLAFNSQPAAAQANPDSVKFRNGRRLYARIIGTGNPSPQAQEASIHILACPEAGAALALQLSSLSQSSDTTQLEAYLGHIQGLRDAALYQAATTLAQDHAATAWRVSPRSKCYSASRGSCGPAAGGACALVKTPQTVETRGAPLPTNYVDAIRALVTQMAGDSADATAVRNAAGCVLNYIHVRLKSYRDWPPPPTW